MHIPEDIFLPLYANETSSWQRLNYQIQSASQVLFLCEKNVTVHALHIKSALFKNARLIEIPSSGEGFKSFQNLEKILGILHQENLDRHSLLIVMGGGAFSDLCGLAASLFHRGIAWIVIPTSLLSMVDAAIGGKTAINLGEVKNLLGTFHEPANLIFYPDCLRTLPQIEFNSGFGEMLKTSLLISNKEFQLVESMNPNQGYSDSGELLKLIDSCMRFKEKIVKADPHETLNLRSMLNLGHTIGHALESEFLYQVPHGICVAYGLWLESSLACKLHNTSPLLPARIARIVRKMNYKLPHVPDGQLVLNRCLGDKKNRNKSIGFVFLREVGELWDGVHAVSRYSLADLKNPVKETFAECFA